MTKRWTFTVGAVGAALILGVTGCSSDSGDDSGTTPSPTPTESNDLSVATPEGEVSLSLDGDLPSGWPSDFPLPDNTEVAGSGSLADTTSGVMVGVYTTDESGSDAYDFYSGEESLSPSDQTKGEAGSGFLGSMKISGQYTGSVTVASISSTTYIVVILDSAGTGSTPTPTPGGA